MYPGFVAATGVDRLADVERYLRAAARRLERLPDATAVDRDRMNAVHELERAYRERLAAAPGTARAARGAVDARGAARQPLRPVARHPRPGVRQADPPSARLRLTAPLQFPTAMSEVRLILMPYELGGLRDGVGRGPEQLLEHGIDDALGACGARVSTELVELDKDFSNEIDACFELIRRVSDQVRAALHDGAFPVVLSGSCFAAVGVVAGLDEPAPGVVWFDAHGDFNCPETTISGYFDGMGLAVLTGGAWQGLLATVPGARPVPESAVVLAGARSLDPPEKPRLEASAVMWLPPPSISSPSRLAEAIAAMDPAPSGLYLHVDLDVLDTTEAKVNIYSAPGGLSAAQLEALVSDALAGGQVRALSMTAYDPQCDVSDAVPPIAQRLGSRLADHLSRSSA